MSSNPNLTERTSDQPQFSSEGLYDSSDLQEDASLKVRLGDHLDRDLRAQLEAGPSTTNSILDFVKRNPVPIALAAGGLIWLLTSSGRRLSRR